MMPDAIEIPRLSAALNAFSSITSQSTNDNTRTDELAEKRRHCMKQIAQQSLSWKKLSKFFEISGRDCRAELRQLIQASKTIVGYECSTDVLESGSVMLFSIFLEADHITQNHSQTLQSYFGPVSSNAISEAHKIVTRLKSLLTEEKLQELFLLFTSQKNLGSLSDDEEFGKNLKFTLPVIDRSNDNYSWLCGSHESAQPFSFNMQFKMEAHADTKQRTLPRDLSEIKCDWLENLLLEFFQPDEMYIGMSFFDLKASIRATLCSSKSDEELQAELFDLLGFDRFELIESLLSNRQKIIGLSNTKEMTIDRSDLLPKTAEPLKPNYGCQVIVQTEEERQLQKLMRREDRKLGKKKIDQEFSNGSATVVDLNPQELRAKREAALLAASSTPLFSSNRSYQTQQQEQYPFVFDAAAAAKQMSGFIGGAKMILPIGFERENNEKYELIDIPPSEKPPADIGKTLVAVNQMDEIGQIAFKGTKNLNLIQSVVYPAAYKSNENLLICAPTGAGKTNIAMLTVLRQLKHHMAEGVIKKDEFKIVYIAPMKALAAEMVRNFGHRLSALGITVMELTGDMQLTKAEISQTQMIVTTPEKWDVVTRKSTGDVALSQIVRLLIIDEVHLLHDDRGSVIESLVARTLRQVESSQTMIRIVGLSATLPNYLDVAHFLRVNPFSGLFVFDGRFRPVPLAQTFIGIKATNRIQQLQDFNNVCYEKVFQQVRHGHQVMVFVHARNETVRTALMLAEMAKNNGHSMLFSSEKSPQFSEATRQFNKSHNRQLRDLFPDGFAIHHAGMLRQDRNLVEKYFAEGLIQCIVCTATLAWGVNLPAHAVVIKGTQMYDAKKGSFVDLGILDVMQIFGRAGRPQFDTYGHGMIITTHDKLPHYLSLLTQQNPIESQFINRLADHLNAEVSLGTVQNVDEAVRWLSYTYLYVRMRRNPLVYGISHQDLQNDPMLELRRKELIQIAGRQLDKARMIRFDEQNGFLHSTDVGRTASHFYIKHDTVEIFNDLFNQIMNDDRILEMVSKAQEFDQIKVRDEEMEELDIHLSNSCQLPVSGGSENAYGKVNILLQTYISRDNVDNFSLVSDQAYVAQNASRIIRALFEMALHKNWPLMAGRMLQMSKMIEKRLWGWHNPIRQFGILPYEILNKLEERGLSIDRLKEMDATEIGHMIRHVKMGPVVKQCVNQIPMLQIEASIQPITRTVLKVALTITAEFKWNDKVHGKMAEPFWLWVEDPENNHIYHHEYLLVHKKNVIQQIPQSLVFTIPIFEPLPSQYYIRVISDRWLGSDATCPISFQHLILPERHPPHTELLDLQPLPVAALNNPRLEQLYKFSHFNPIQTQIFYTLYHTDGNVLLGAPTGSGKTVAAELAIFRVFREYPESKAVYIAPLKALVRERMEDWKVRIEEKLGKRVVELTGDVVPDMKAVANADLIVTTPEKWDGVSRSWQSRSYVKAVSLLVIDEIHLLGDDRGPVLEVIVSRTNFISSHTERQVRVVGLSTALANARDLADWLAIKQVGLFNFRPSVRPVPLEVHISGFPGKHYCPRMATMNKPTFQAIKTHSPNKPVLVFVSSRRQTRLTALDLIAYLASDDDPKQWLHMQEEEMENVIAGIKENNLKLTLAFGIGLHHAGLHERDRKTVEELFVNQKIQILIATSTLAWGVNFPAHLVVVKGTEYYDGKTKRYVDFPITDVLQMMGRAGRPQFDDQGKAVILVHDVKKHFYKKFLYEPFPVESSLLEVLPDHLNAEIVAGTISSKQDATDYLTWTYFFRRLIINPSYYKLEDVTHNQINQFLSELVQRSIQDLYLSSCVEVAEDDVSLSSTTLGRIASYYYLNHLTLRHFREGLSAECALPYLIKVLADAHEFSQLPVRHNEDHVNSELAQKLPLPVDPHTFDSSNTKTYLLLQAHFSRIQLPSTDYYTDTKSVMDQTMRVLQAMLDMCADEGWLVTTLRVINLMQMVIQGQWLHESTLLSLPHIQSHHLNCFRMPAARDGTKPNGSSSSMIECLPELIFAMGGKCGILEEMLKNELNRIEIEQIFNVLNQLPVIQTIIGLKESFQDESRKDSKETLITINRQGGGRISDDDCIAVIGGQEYMLNVHLTRLNKTKRRDTRAFPTRFQKPKDEGWILLLGDIESREVIAMKRIGYIKHRTSAQLAFFSPERYGRFIYTLYILSDSYLGMDQQYDINLLVNELSDDLNDTFSSNDPR